jgi:rhodanese-related sulfurtransferase
MGKITVKEICPSTTQLWIKEGALLVDVREKDEVDELSFNVPNIINIPLSEFEERYSEIPQNQKIVVVCRSGSRSLRAAGYLIYHNYSAENVVNMQHGIIRWAQKGFPLLGNINSVLTTENNSSCCDSANNEKQSNCCNTEKTNNNCC